MMEKAAAFVCFLALAIMRIDISVCGTALNFSDLLKASIPTEHPRGTAALKGCRSGQAKTEVCRKKSYCMWDRFHEMGRWTTQDITCDLVTCEEPQNPKHGKVKLIGDLKVGSLATYSCNPGRKLYGSTTSKCLESGKWTFEAPPCLSSCKVPFIEKGEMGRYETKNSTRSRQEFKKVFVGEDVDSSEKLIFRCKNDTLPAENSQLLNNNILEVTCIDGTWSKELRCKQNISVCGSPPDIAGAATPQLNAMEHPLGTAVVYNCPLGYVANNFANHISVCKINNETGKPEWTVPKITCNQPCYTRYLSYPGLVKPPQEYFENFENFEIHCEQGYRSKTRDQKIRCVRGEWDISDNPCTFGNDSCPEFPNSPEVKTTYSNDLLVGSIATFECSMATKHLIGSNSSMCQESRSWSNPFPSCAGVQRCLLNLNPSSHLLVEPKKDGYRMGEFIFVSCPPGEVLSKKVERLMCFAGRWSDSLPECIELESKDQH